MLSSYVVGIGSSSCSGMETATRNASRVVSRFGNRVVAGHSLGRLFGNPYVGSFESSFLVPSTPGLSSEPR
jgi:hypothetical protein